MSSVFRISSKQSPAGDQPTAIRSLSDGIRKGAKNQVLLGVTGSGKTHTMARVISQVQMPTLILAHNKTLAAQLYEEMRSFFPDNAVEYFVSYYNYYRPEAYIPHSDTYLSKESSVNPILDRMRHSATRALMERRDVIIISSVSCIYGLGGAEAYRDRAFEIKKGAVFSIPDIKERFISLLYKPVQGIKLTRGHFRLHQNKIELIPSHLDEHIWTIHVEDEKVTRMTEHLSAEGKVEHTDLDVVSLYPNSHYLSQTLPKSIEKIEQELEEWSLELKSRGKMVELERIRERTLRDLELLKTTTTCPGVENYTRHINLLEEGEAAPTLFSYFPKPHLLIVDESHMTVPQIRAMYRGDQKRKQVLIDHGFRMPSARDNRPLKFEEWDSIRESTIFVSATPASFEIEVADNVVEQVVRPTGLLDPLCYVRPAKHQVNDVLSLCKEMAEQNQRVMVLVTTRAMALSLADHLASEGLKAAAIHAGVETPERTSMLRDLRRGKLEVIVGINLLREGIDVPECRCVAVLDADQEGFLRTPSALIQIIGRAARHEKGFAVLYADKTTEAMKKAMDETARRREKQNQHNINNGIVPTRALRDIAEVWDQNDDPMLWQPDESYPILKEAVLLEQKDRDKLFKKIKRDIKRASTSLEFEKASRIRDYRAQLEQSI